VLEHDEKFIATEAADEVPGAQFSFESRAHVAQKLISRRMPKAVIDLLKAVKIDHHNGERAVIDGGVFKRNLQPSFQLAAVEETRQRIVARLV
jgi:hypothetical protein